MNYTLSLVNYTLLNLNKCYNTDKETKEMIFDVIKEDHS